MDRLIDTMVRQQTQAIEQFLRSQGVTDFNAHEYGVQIVRHGTPETNLESTTIYNLFRFDKHVGTLEIKLVNN